MNEATASAVPLFKDKPGNVLLKWVPGSPSVGSAMASAMVGSVGLDSPTVADIHRIIAPADTTPINLVVSGADSRFAAKVAVAALNQVPGMLPKLSLAFVGNQSDAAEIRSAVEARGGTFLFAPAN